MFSIFIKIIYKSPFFQQKNNRNCKLFEKKEKGYRVKYFNTTKLFAKPKMAKADGSYLKEMAKLERQNLITLDDFGLQPLDSRIQLILMELIEDRNGKVSEMLTSQILVKGWYDLIGEKTIAYAIMDRLVHLSNRIELTGKSMQKKIV